MERGSFEDKIAAQFNAANIAPPSSVWAGVESHLNAKAVAAYQAQILLYKKIAVAAVILLFSSISFYILDQIGEHTISGQSFLKNGQYYLQSGTVKQPGFQGSYVFYNWKPFYVADTKQSRRNDEESLQKSPSNVGLISLLSQEDFLGTTDVPGVNQLRSMTVLPFDHEIEVAEHLYRLPVQPRSNRKKTVSNKYFAGVNAGAGIFDPQFGNTQDLNATIDQGLVATETGSSEFVNPDFNVTQSQLNEGISSTLGLGVGMNLNSKWSIESGLSLNNFRNEGTANINVLDNFTISASTTETLNNTLSISPLNSERVIEVEEEVEQEVEVKNQFQLASVPVKAGFYVVKRKMSLKLNAGIAVNYLTDNRTIDESGQILSTENVLVNDWSLDGLSGIELGYSFGEKLDFIIAPNYRYSFSSFNTAFDDLSHFQLQSGFKYKFN